MQKFLLMWFKKKFLEEKKSLNERFPSSVTWEGATAQFLLGVRKEEQDSCPMV